MKVVYLPPTYLQEQIYNNLASNLESNMSDYKDRVVLLPRTLWTLSNRLLRDKTIREDTLKGKNLVNLVYCKFAEGLFENQKD